MRRLGSVVVLVVLFLVAAPTTAPAAGNGAIQGRITDAGGAPLAGAVVTASSPDEGVSWRQVTTDADGEFHFDGLDSAAYSVCVSAVGVTGGESATGYLDRCHGSEYAKSSGPVQRPWDTATTFQVASGQTVNVPDLSLRSAAQLRGTLTDPNGTPVPNVKVYGWGSMASGASLEATAVSDATGSFVLEFDALGGKGLFHGARLPEVPFTVLFAPSTTAHVTSYYPHVPSPGEQSWGTVPETTPVGGEPTVIDDVLPLGGSLGGIVTDSSGTGLSDVRVVVRHGSLQVGTVRSDENGGFALPGLPTADYTVCFEASGAHGGVSDAGYLNRCWGDSPASSPATLHLDPGQHRTDAGGTLPSAAGITGVIRGPSGEPVGDVRVTFYRDDAGDCCIASRPDGSFQSTRLEPGPYTVCFTPSQFTTPNYLPECWKDREIGGGRTPVNTTAGKFSTLEVTLAEAPPVSSAPVVVLGTPSPLVSATTTVTASYSSADASSGILDHDVRYRTASWNGDGFGAWTYPTAWQHRSATSVSVGGSPGRTYCFSVRARDLEGNVSAWTAERCRAVPLDDRSLVASSGWERLSNSGSYAGSLTRSSKPGATLRTAAASVAHAGLVFTACRTCGKVGIYVASRLVATIDTRSATTRRMVVALAPRIALTRATVSVRVLERRWVYVDGLAVTRR